MNRVSEKAIESTAACGEKICEHYCAKHRLIEKYTRDTYDDNSCRERHNG